MGGDIALVLTALAAIIVWRAVSSRFGHGGPGLPSVFGGRRPLDRQTEAQALLRERRRIAADLHDGALQLLATALASLRSAQRVLERYEHGHPAREPLTDGIQLVQAAVNEMRSILFPLTFDAPEPPGLAATVQRVMRRFSPASPMAVHITPLPDLSAAPVVEEAVMGIITEALANAAKHAHAGNVWVDVSVDAGMVSCRIRDDGVGFDLQAMSSQASARKSLGLHLVRERARLAGGDVTITSHPKSGTVIEARLPLRRPPDTAPASGGRAEEHPRRPFH